MFIPEYECTIATGSVGSPRVNPVFIMFFKHHLLKFPAVKAAALCLTALLCTPASADLLFRFYNQAPMAAKGVVQDMSVLWLRPDQNEVARATGDWTVPVPCPIGGCAKLLKDGYTVNFEHLNDAGTQYCVWRILHTVKRQGVSGYGWRDGHEVGSVNIRAELKHQQPGYSCTVGGQSTADWASDKRGNGIEVHFFLKKTAPL